jgi:hypothetical protein
MKTMLPCVTWVLLTVTSIGQTQALTTTYNHNNGQAGNMFDVVAINQVTICWFDVNVDPGTWDFEVYTHPGTWVGTETNAMAWTLVGSTTNVTSNATSTAAPGVPTLLPIPIGVTIPAGTTQAFYVTVTNGASMNYSGGGVVGNVFASDANIQILEGAGNPYPFVIPFLTRNWNGTVHYVVGAGPCPPLPTPTYQANQANATLDINGVQASAAVPATTSVCLNESVTLNVGSASPTAFDIAIAVSPLIPSPPGFVTPGRQVVNVNLADPSLFFLNNLTFPPFVPFSQPLSSSTAVTVSGQMIMLDAGQMDGFSLSQGVQLAVTNTTTVAGPSGNNVGSQVILMPSPVCGPASIPFCGTSYTDIHIMTNGRITFGGADIDFSPTIQDALIDNPFVGFWTDLDTDPASTISVVATSTLVTVNFNNLVYYAEPGSSVSFSCSFDANGTVRLFNLTGINPNPLTNSSLPAGDAQFFGLSSGNLLTATNTGPTTFGVGMSGTNPGGQSMLYDFWDGAPGTAPGSVGLVSSLQGPLQGITFVPSGVPGEYSYTGT